MDDEKWTPAGARLRTRSWVPYRLTGPAYSHRSCNTAGQRPDQAFHLDRIPSFFDFWPFLAKDRVVVAAGTPGYGMSDRLPEPPEIGDYADAMFGFMEHLASHGILAPGPFDVMGYHTGSITATEMARRDRQRVRRCVLFGLAAYTEDVRAERLARLSERFPPPDRTLGHVEKFWSIIGELADPRIPAEQLHIGMAESLRLGKSAPLGIYRCLSL